MKLTEEDKKQIIESISHYPQKRAAVMDALRFIQKQYQHIPEEIIPELSEMLEMPEKDIMGLITFYTMYSQTKRGKFHIQVCTNISCKVNGGVEIFNAVSNHLNLKHNETDADGFFSLEEVECMGACGGAPMLAVNDRYFEKIDVSKAISLLEDIKTNQVMPL